LNAVLNIVLIIIGFLDKFKSSRCWKLICSWRCPRLSEYLLLKLKGFWKEVVWRVDIDCFNLDWVIFTWNESDINDGLVKGRDLLLVF
jgi:hypothetical protein